MYFLFDFIMGGLLRFIIMGGLLRFIKVVEFHAYQ